MNRIFLAAGSLLGFLAVAAGAFGAHLLRDRLGPEMSPIWETAARYQLVHAVVLLFIPLAAGRWPSGLWSAAGWSFVAGTVVFSGSLYVLAGTGVRAWGAVTPVGGLGLLVGWLFVAAAALRA
ncbi:MAG: DUF423 domain-containing protein [Gemmatimonadota bacterium]